MRSARTVWPSGTMSLSVVGLTLGVAVMGVGCKRKDFTHHDKPAAAVPKATPIASDVVAKPGMVFVPPGVLKAGTPVNVTPRVADEEMPGTPVGIDGFYIDQYPYPNEPGAIPLTSVTRDEAQKACNEKGKRLCTELEWERACKGSQNSTYEYGSTYRANACGLGVSADRAARRPTAEHPVCKSEFGVTDMHGGAFEWTDSTWSRGNVGNEGASAQGDRKVLGVVRGGNGAPGDLTGRCANATARAANAKHTTVGFRCCAGPRNDDEVSVNPVAQNSLEKSARVEELTEPIAEVATTLWGSPETRGGEYEFSRAWTWRPVAGEELVVALGCERKGGPWARCGLVVARVVDTHATVLGQAATGNHLGDLMKGVDSTHLRVRAMDRGGTLARDIAYSAGRIILTEESRP